VQRRCSCRSGKRSRRPAARPNETLSTRVICCGFCRGTGGTCAGVSQCGRQPIGTGLIYLNIFCMQAANVRNDIRSARTMCTPAHCVWQRRAMSRPVLEGAGKYPKRPTRSMVGSIGKDALEGPVTGSDGNGRHLRPAGTPVSHVRPAGNSPQRSIRSDPFDGVRRRDGNSPSVPGARWRRRRCFKRAALP
jgi:hypothetical protein